MALAVVTGQQNHHTSSADQSDGQEVRLATLLRQLWSSNMTYSLAVLLLKDSLLFQYLRFSIDVGYRRACWALGAIITIYGVSAFFVSIFSCQPIAYSWNSNIHGGKCIDFLAFWLFNASFNSATDIIVCALPIPVLKALQLPRKQMAILTCIFLLGALVCIASIIRLFAVYGATVHNKDDPAITIWSAVEVNLGIICACLPSLRHPITQFSPRILALHHRRTAHETGAQSHRSNSNSTSTTLKYPEAVVTCIDRSLSPGGSLQNGIELTAASEASQDRDRTHTGSEGAASRSCTDGGEDHEDGSAETSHQPFLTMSDRKGSWPTISTVTEYDVEEMDTDPAEEDASLQPQRLAPIPRAHLPPSRPLGPRPPVVQTKSPGPPPVQAAPPPPPVVVPRSQKRSRSKNKGPPRPLFPLACIPESSGPNTPVDGTCPSTSTQGNGEKDGQAQENEQMQQQQNQNQNHDGNTSIDNDTYYQTKQSSSQLRSSKPDQQQEPTIIIPPANPLEQQSSYYNTQSQTQTQPLQAPDSPTSTYTSTSITTISSYSYGNNNNSQNNSHIAPWMNQEQSSNHTEKEKRCACRASKTYSYEILGGPQALRELQDSESNSTCCPRPISDHRRPTSPLAKMRSLTKSKQQPVSLSASTPSSSPSKPRTKISQTTAVDDGGAVAVGCKDTTPQSRAQAQAPAREIPVPVSAETAGLGVNLGVSVSSPSQTRGAYHHHHRSTPPTTQTQTQVPSTSSFYQPVTTPVKQQQKQQQQQKHQSAAIIQDKYAREEQRRNLERARRKQREREREAERQRERAMQLQIQTYGPGYGEFSSTGTGAGAGVGIVRPLGPRQMR
ncbi:hypothetical protein ABEF95_002965 [Exophiala dermatitidis]